MTPAPSAQAELVHQAADVVLFVADSEVSINGQSAVSITLTIQ